MTLSNYPKNFDANSNLYEVHDYLRVYLAEDYTPGDTVIYVYGDSEILSRFPNLEGGGGIITLTDQCDELSNRALSFYYTTKTTISSTSVYFSGIELLPGFTDVKKYKDITSVTQNVMAEHHNSLKDAILNIEKFSGIKGEISKLPLEGTIEQRINYLRYLVLAPKAWFSINKKIGLKPSKVTFNDLSFRLGTDGTSKSIYYTWDFDAEPQSTVNYESKKFSYYKSYSFEKLATGEIKTNIKFSIEEKSSYFSSTYTLQKSTDNWETYVDVNNNSSSTITYSSTKKNPEYRILLGGGGEYLGGITLYINLGQDVLDFTYFDSGFFNVSLNVKNDFGDDTAILRNITNVREFCPDEAKIDFTASVSQFKVRDENNNRKNTITSPTNLSVFMSIIYNGENESDPINSYTWDIQDDLTHLNQDYTKASFSVGGIYDVILRTDTKSGNYRITTFKSSIDIIEKTNLWLWTASKSKSSPGLSFPDGVSITAHEFGLISETFKTLGPQNIVPKDSSFLGDINTNSDCDCCYSYSETCRKLREFDRNNGFAKIGSSGSGDKTTDGLIFWASGRDTELAADEKILFKRYNAFGDYYSTDNSYLQRQWGWVSFAPDTNVYFLLGNKGVGTDTSSGVFDCKGTVVSGSNSSNEIDNVLNTFDVSTENVSSCVIQSFKNNADDILGYSVDGYSYYRSTWKDGTGYILSNVSGSEYFRIKNFYKTSGTISNSITDITKLNDMSGPAKTEGELVTFSDSIYFFNNSGSISAYNTTTGAWTTGGPGVGSIAFKSLQDSSIEKFDDINQSLFATSDEDHNAYISYEYSPKSFVKFNDIDLTFRYLGYRPNEANSKQWLSTIY
jgi:hypothetical protein